MALYAAAGTPDASPLETGDAGTLCGAVDQEGPEMRIDEFNGERRVWLRPQWIYYKNLGKLPGKIRFCVNLLLTATYWVFFFFAFCNCKITVEIERWKKLDESLKDHDYAFQNQGEMHPMDDFGSRAAYYCGLLPHVLAPWSVSFRTYERFSENPSAPRAPVRRARYTPADVAVGIYTGERFLRTRASACNHFIFLIICFFF